jgi:hypothetical protein
MSGWKQENIKTTRILTFKINEMASMEIKHRPLQAAIFRKNVYVVDLVYLQTQPLSWKRETITMKATTTDITNIMHKVPLMGILDARKMIFFTSNLLECNNKV